MSRLSQSWHLAFAAAAITICLLLASALDSPLTAVPCSHLRGIALQAAFREMP